MLDILGILIGSLFFSTNCPCDLRVSVRTNKAPQTNNNSNNMYILTDSAHVRP